jgi:phosphoserine aminotransferase
MKWLKNLGGIETIDEINKTKAIVMYSEIDLNPLFKGFAAVEDRSTMNATFSLVNDGLKNTFESMMKEAGIEGINGHRSVGGYRASMYNALSLDSVKVLVEVMSELETKA